MISKRIRNGLFALAAPLLLAASPATASKDTPTIGVVVPTLDAQFWNNYIDFMKKGAKELGVDLIVLNADNKPDQNHQDQDQDQDDGDFGGDDNDNA